MKNRGPVLSKFVSGGAEQVRIVQLN